MEKNVLAKLEALKKS